MAVENSTHLSFAPHGLKHRQSFSDCFQVYFSTIKRQTEDWKTECLYTAQSIKKIKKKPVRLFLSGGIDSSAVALCLKETQVEFQPMIIEFNDQLNAHDIQYAFSLCHQINIHPTVIKVDPVREWKKKGAYFSKKVQCGSPQLILCLMICDELDGFFIFGGGDPYFEWCPKRSCWFWKEEEKFYSASKYFFQRGLPACTHFFSSTSEMILAQLTDQLTQSLLKNQGKEADFINYKSDLYNKHFGLSRREKYTGFEKLKDEDYKYRKIFSSSPLNKNQILYASIPSIVKNLTRETGVMLQ